MPIQLYEACKRASGMSSSEPVQVYIDLIKERKKQELQCYFRAFLMTLQLHIYDGAADMSE